MRLSDFISFLAVVLVSTEVASNPCPTFKSLQSTFKGPQSESFFRCEPECLQKTTKEVFGTLMYTEGSDVCLASLHAGAVNINGGSVQVQQMTVSNKDIHGTCRNRVCSKSIKATGNIYTVKQKESIINEKVGGDLVLIHNNYWEDILNLVCLTERSNVQLSTDSIRRWNYKILEGPQDAIDRSKVVMTSSASQNYHAFHCVGNSPATDVFAAVTFPYAEYNVSQNTWRASKGDDMKVDFSVAESASRNPAIQRIPEGTGDASLSFTNASPEDNALYLIGDNVRGAYLNVMIRDCERDKFGSDCQFTCPKCQNNGQCHTSTGECLCPPGFRGKFCEKACTKGWFGTGCQMQCNITTLSFQLPEEEGSCKGLTFCLPSPMGCICAAGYQGMACDQPCGFGEYGAGCSGKCQQKCQTEDCDPITGKCPPTSPKNVSSNATGPRELTVSWDTDELEDNEIYHYTIKYKLLEWMSCDATYHVEEWKTITQEEKLAVITGLEAHAAYKVCIGARDSDQKISPEVCLISATNVTDPILNITDLFCSIENPDTYSIVCSASIQGNCSHFNAPGVNLIFSLSSHLDCNDSTTLIEERVTLSSKDDLHSGIVNHTFSNVSPGQSYEASVRIHELPDPIYPITDQVVVEEEVPPPIDKLIRTRVNQSYIKLIWDDPCPSNGKVIAYRIAVEGLLPETEVYKNDSICLEDLEYNQCYDVSGLEIGKVYNASISLRNSKYWSKLHNFTLQLSETKPGLPKLANRLRQARSMNLSLLPPTDMGGILENCTIDGLDHPCVMKYKRSKAMECHFDNLESGMIYKIQAYCCNEKFCGDKLFMEVATKATPSLQGEVNVHSVTNSTITVSLPHVVNEGDGQSDIAVIVQIVAGEPAHDLKEVAEILLNETRNNKEMQHDSDCNATIWIAGLIPDGTKYFEVGNGKEYGGIYNCPLKFGETYVIGVLATTEIQGDRSEMWQQCVDEVQVVPLTKPGLPFTEITIVILVAVFILIVVVLAVFVCRNRRSQTEEIAVKFTKEEVEPAAT